MKMKVFKKAGKAVLEYGNYFSSFILRSSNTDALGQYSARLLTQSIEICPLKQTSDL